MIAGRSASASSFAASSTPSADPLAHGRRVRDLGLGLGEDDVERIVDEGRAERRLGGGVDRLRGGRARSSPGP